MLQKSLEPQSAAADACRQLVLNHLSHVGSRLESYAVGVHHSVVFSRSWACSPRQYPISSGPESLDHTLYSLASD